MKQHLFTLCILALYTINVFWYAFQKDFGRSLYWLFAAGITITATWFIK